MRQGRQLLVEAYDRAQTKKLATGTLLALDSQIDTGTGTIKLKALFSNEDGSLYPNQFVNARLLVSTQHDATLLPSTAIQHNAQGPFVYLVQSDQALAMRSVTLVTTEGNNSSVDGLAPGDVVVADNFNRLQEGMKIGVRGSEGAEPKRSRGTNAPRGGSLAP